MTQMLTIKGERFYLLDEAEYRRLGSTAPVFPAPLAGGNFPAAQAVRASMARQIIDSRMALGLSQAELARRAHIPVASLNRIERGMRSPQARTMTKIERALVAAKR